MDNKTERRFLFLNAQRFPARLTGEEIAVLLGFQEHDIPELVKSKLLKPIGNPIRNAVKYFAAVEIEALAGDKEWLHRTTKALYRGRSAKPVDSKDSGNTPI